ncbi:hypothetical protein Tco_0328527 [Tanacetum coccineum]
MGVRAIVYIDFVSIKTLASFPKMLPRGTSSEMVVDTGAGAVRFLFRMRKEMLLKGDRHSGRIASVSGVKRTKKRKRLAFPANLSIRRTLLFPCCVENWA